MDHDALIDEGLKQLAIAAGPVAEYDRYYRGDHPTPFATAKFLNAFGHLLRQTRDNLMPSIVKARTDRLRIDLFDTAAAAASDPTPTGAATGDTDQVRALAAEITATGQWKVTAADALRTAVSLQSAYLLVWPDIDTGRPVWSCQRPDVFTIVVDPENPARKLAAVKAWREGKRWRVNLYTGDVIVKRISRAADPAGRPKRATQLMPYVDPDTGADTVVNPWGVVPAFELDAGACVFAQAMPLVDAGNKSLADMLVGMESHALPQRGATGVDPGPPDPVTGRPRELFKSHPGSVWTHGNPAAKFFQFDAANLEQLIAVQESFRLEQARVTHTPPRLLGLVAGTDSSGEQIRMDERPLTAEVVDLQDRFTDAFADAMALSLRMLGVAARVAVVWANPAPVDDAEAADLEIKRWQAAQARQAVGVPFRHNMRAAGYTDAEIDDMLAEKARDQVAAPQPDMATAMRAAFAAGRTRAVGA